MVVQTFRRLNYLLGCSVSVSIFIDHRNFATCITLYDCSAIAGAVQNTESYPLGIVSIRFCIQDRSCSGGFSYDGIYRDGRDARILLCPIFDTTRRTPTKDLEMLCCSNRSSLPGHWPTRDMNCDAQSESKQSPVTDAADKGGHLRVNDKP